jgi:hypothetical protein
VGHPGRHAERLDAAGVLVQQEAQLVGRLMSRGDREQHVVDSGLLAQPVVP